MSPEDKLQEVLAYAGHLADCDTECGWPCTCGWEEVKDALQNRRREAVLATRAKHVGEENESRHT